MVRGLRRSGIAQLAGQHSLVGVGVGRRASSVGFRVLNCLGDLAAAEGSATAADGWLTLRLLFRDGSSEGGGSTKGSHQDDEGGELHDGREEEAKRERRVTMKGGGRQERWTKKDWLYDATHAPPL